MIFFKNVSPLISFVVAITNSTFESSCCDRKRRAEISANVQPPIKNTKITRGVSESVVVLFTTCCCCCCIPSSVGPIKRKLEVIANTHKKVCCTNQVINLKHHVIV